MLANLRMLPPAVWLRTLPYAAVAALLIGLPSDLVPNPFFGRPVPIRPIDYLIWAVTSLLIGLVFAVRRKGSADDEDTGPVWGGFVSFLAVGCPSCNQVVVAIVGTSGALSWWAPVQPFIGLAAIGLLLYALRRRLETYELDACPLPGAACEDPVAAAGPGSHTDRR